MTGPRIAKVSAKVKKEHRPKGKEHYRPRMAGRKMFLGKKPLA